MANIPSNLVNVHDSSKCRGRHCCVHNPSNHHMLGWPVSWRADKRTMERICEHGIGHPDPDDAAYLASIGKDYLNTHGCDGCCRPPKPPAPIDNPQRVRTIYL